MTVKRITHMYEMDYTESFAVVRSDDKHILTIILQLISIMSYERIDPHLIKSYFEKSEDLGLANGKMGACLYAFLKPAQNVSAFDKKFANAMLCNVCDNIFRCSNLNIRDGILGISLGLYILKKRGLISLNIKPLLKEVDNYIYMNTADSAISHKNIDIFDVLYYLYIRIAAEKTRKMDKEIFCDLGLYLLNLSYSMIENFIFKEPTHFSVYYNLARFLHLTALYHEVNIHYKDRIGCMWRELEPYIFSFVPYRHGNKLTLMLACKYIKTVYHNYKLDNFYNTLKKLYSWQKLFETEIRDKQIFFSDGLMGCYIISRQLGFNIDYMPIYNRIVNSSIWDSYSIYSPNLRIGIDGYLGVDLFKQHINQYKL